ncbi:MAG: YeeE/YedE family protein [Burkholderiaceae bacterium]|nr:YeeE/YedE family protein [Burkholderiaceae bacterium]
MGSTARRASALPRGARCTIAAAFHTVLWSTFALAFVLGLVANKTHFCTMGAVADIVNFGDWTRMRQWLMAIGIAVIATGMLAATGAIDPAKSIYTGNRLLLLGYVVGGLLFGVGMVLAGGCGSKTLIRVGTGNLKALIVFVVLGVTAFITLRGALGVLRVSAIEPVSLTLATPQDLPSLLAGATGLARDALQWALPLLVGGALLAFALARRSFWTLDNLLAGLVVGGVIAAVWYVSGHVGFVAEHPETLEETYLATNSGRMESLSFVAPIAYVLDWLMFFSDKSKVLTLGTVAVFGVVAGSAAWALLSREFRWEGFRDTEDTANHIVGGMLMGFGGVVAMGCTVGQGLSGVSTLALGSFIALASIISGAVLGLKYQSWRLEHMA